MDKIYWLGFSVFPGIGPKKFGLLLERFGTAEGAWKAGIYDLEVVLGKALTPKLVTFREKFSPQEYERKLRASGVNFLTLAPEFRILVP
jgi:predicted Rossmann fold nucleotide-binding protein DprA/Smf involved in DNA uptake